MARRQYLTVFTLIFVSFFISYQFVSHFRNQPAGTRDPALRHRLDNDNNSNNNAHLAFDQELLLHGAASAPKLENATLKAELGRSTWHYLHTVLAKFPETPTKEDSDSLKAYLYLFARLYPCGDCARHFQQIMSTYPPQVSGRKAASTWGCFVHNEVNRSLKKPEFDCGKIGDFYDCGCGGDKNVSDEKSVEAMQLKLDKEEGLTRGG